MASAAHSAPHPRSAFIAVHQTKTGAVGLCVFMVPLYSSVS